MGSFFTNELLEEAAAHIASGLVVPEQDSSKYFNLINRRFPFCGSYIDWDRMPQSVYQRQTSRDPLSEAKLFMRKEFERNGLPSETSVVVLGDAVDCALRTTISGLVLIADSVLEIPQHTCIIPPDASWCLMLTFGGDMGFGFSPVPVPVPCPFAVSAEVEAWLASILVRPHRHPGFSCSPRFGVYKGKELVEEFVGEHFRIVQASLEAWLSHEASQVVVAARPFWILPKDLESLRGKTLSKVYFDVSPSKKRPFVVAV